MLEGEVISLCPAPSPIALSPTNNQVQLSSISVRLPEQPSSALSAAKKGAAKKSGVVRMNEIVIQTHAIIGSGSFGIVYRASCHRYKSLALKVCHGKPNRLQKEWAALSKCASDVGAAAPRASGKASSKGSKSAPVSSAAQQSNAIHIPRVYFAAWSKDDPSLLVIGMELCVPLTLHDYLMQESFALNVAGFLAQEVAQAVHFVHSRGCIHRDIKLQNFVFSLDGHLKLIDFGIATDTLNPPPGDVTAGTLAFMSPEMATNVLSAKSDRVVVGAPADVWSLGTVLFCIFTQADLYTDMDEDPQTPGGQDVNARLLHRVSRGEWRWPASASIPKPFKDVITKCMQLSPSDRPTMEELMTERCWAQGELSVPSEVKAFLAVESLGVDEKGAVRVEGASVRKSPLGRPGVTPSARGGGQSTSALKQSLGVGSANSLIQGILSPSRDQFQLSPQQQQEQQQQQTVLPLQGSVPVSRALLTADTSPTTFRAPPQLPPPPSATFSTPLPVPSDPMGVFSPSKKEADDLLLGLISPPNRLTCTVSEPLMTPSAFEVTPLAEAKVERKPIHPQLLKKKLPKAASATIAIEEKTARMVVAQAREQDMEDLQRLFTCQSLNFNHPHRFKFYDKPMNKSYKEGYMCDTCGVFFTPKKGWMPFFHCSCGSDLCEPCHEVYARGCTCTLCSATLDNLQSLQRHMSRCEQKAQSRRGSLSMAGRKRERSLPMTGRGGAEGGQRISFDTTIRHLPRASSKSGSRSRGALSGLSGLGLGGGSDAPQEFSLPTVPASSTPLVTAPIELNPVNPTAGAQWSPFESSRRQAAAEVAAVNALQPTPEERNAIVGDASDWVRYYHYYPEGPGAEALVYSAQPGRTGSIFLSNTSSIHSAIVAVVESKTLVVDYVDAQTGLDRVRTLSLEEAKLQQPTAVEILLNVIQRDTNLFKQRRAVGTMSVYQRPQAGIGCFGAAFLYVRWVRRDVANRIDVFCLSNGGYQAFVQDTYEIRWMEGGRKFRVRSNGVCDLIDEATFASIPALVALTQPI